MSTATDFRTARFSVVSVGNSGRFIGHTVYWKLYAIENLLRVIINSVLSSIWGQSLWWQKAASTIKDSRNRTLDDKVKSVRQEYARNPHVTSPGRHEIYYLFLPDLSTIIFVNKSVFIPTLNDIDNWILRLDRIRLPRNIVGHMNWLNANDRKEIDKTYEDLKELMEHLSPRLKIIVPP